MTDDTPNAGIGSGLTAGALISAAVALLALPSAVLAFTVDFKQVGGSHDRDGADAIFAGSKAPGRLASEFPARSLAKGQRYSFTPAATPTRPDRSITVAVRVDPETARTLAAARPRIQPTKPAEGTGLRIAQMGFSLGVPKGFSNLSPLIARGEEKSGSSLPDLSAYRLPSPASSGDSRLSPRIVIDEKASAGRSPRTFAGDNDDRVDVGGSYRVTKNLNLTAGVRYSQERERLEPVSDGKQDNQAVYLGTQFKF